MVLTLCAFAGNATGRAENSHDEGKAESSVYANVGYSYMTSKFYIPQGSTGDPKHGLDWTLAYDWVSRKGIGVGLMYSGYKSSYTYFFISDILLTYIAPQFVMKQKLGKWGIEEKIGIGYFGYSESSNVAEASLSGVGYNVALGAEYRLSKLIGIGANFGYIVSSLSEQDDAEQGKKERSGISRLHVGLGLRVHFSTLDNGDNRRSVEL